MHGKQLSAQWFGHTNSKFLVGVRVMPGVTLLKCASALQVSSDENKGIFVM